jgi:hypothetical protein
VYKPTEVVETGAYGEAGGVLEIAGRARSSASLGGNREKDAGGMEKAAGAGREAAATEVAGGAVKEVDEEAAAEVVMSRSIFGLIPCKT